MSDEERRGSDGLIEAYRKGGFLLNPDVVEELSRVVAERKLSLHDVLIKGQPRPDFLHAKFVVRGAAAAGKAIGDFLVGFERADVPAKIEVFPIGVPAEQFTIDVVIANNQL